MSKLSSGGTKKYGRIKNKPAQVRYTSERRWIKNKRRKMQNRANETNKVVKYKIDGEWESIKPNK